MIKELWFVIFAVALFVSLIVGYSIPPMLEVGMIGGEKENIGLNTDISDDLLDHYKQLDDEP